MMCMASSQSNLKHCHPLLTSYPPIMQLTTGVFESIVPAVVPSDVYVAATVDQGLNVVNACKSLGIPTIPCLGHRIHSSVMWGIGVSGSVATQKNKKGRVLVGRCAACAGMFSHSCTNSDAFRLVQETMHAKQREEMEQFRIDASAIEEAAEGATPATAATAATEGIPKALNICRRNDTRCDIFLFFVRSTQTNAIL